MGNIWKWLVKMVYKTGIFPSIGLLCLIAFSMTAIGADDFALVRKINLSPALTPMKGFSNVDSFGLSRDSGILIAGQFHDERDAPMAFLMKITPQAVAQWQLLSAHEPLYDPPTSIFDASDGGYWIIGKGHIEDPGATKASSLKWNERISLDIKTTYFYLGKVTAVMTSRTLYLQPIRHFLIRCCKNILIQNSKHRVQLLAYLPDRWEIQK